MSSSEDLVGPGALPGDSDEPGHATTPLTQPASGIPGGAGSEPATGSDGPDLHPGQGPAAADDPPAGDGAGPGRSESPPAGFVPVRDRDSATVDTVVIEADVIPRRLRRPIDLLRLVSAVLLAAILFSIAYFASETTRGLDSDLTQATTRIPGVIMWFVTTIGLIGVLGLPVATAVDLVYRRRGRLLAEALGGLAVAVVVAAGLNWAMTTYPNPQLLQALTGQEAPGQLPPLNAILAGLVAFITISRLVERPRLGPISIVVVVAIVLANIITGGITAAALALSILLGWSVGLIARYVLGTPTTRPSGTAVAASLDHAGFPITVLRAQREISGGRLYVATTRSGASLNVTVLDRDLEGAGLASSIWRTVRIRDDSAPSRMSMRRRLERTALQAYAAHASGAPVPRLLAAVQVGADAALLAYPRINGQLFADIGPDLTDSDLDGAWHALRTLQDADISHRSLTGRHLLRDTTGHVWMLNPDEGAIAASDLAERLDMAELLCTLALLTDPDRAVASGTRVLGVPRLVKALSVMQPIALSAETRRSIRKRRDLLVKLRDSLIEMSPTGAPEPIEVQRLRPRTVLTIVAGTVAGYILLTQLAQVDLVTLFRDADWRWAFVAILLSAATYIGATMSLEGFVPEKLKFWRTFQAQLAASFATLVSPPTLGAVAVNLRYLQRSGVNPALAAASVGVSQVMAFVVHLTLLLGFGVIAGTRQSAEVKVPSWAVIVIVVLLVIAVLALLLPWSRRWLTKRVRPIFQQVGPRLLTLLQQPSKLAVGVGGILVLNVGYCACLAACVWAFGGSAPIAGVAVVYLAGATIGQAAPTPGGLGAVEAALSAGLTAIGIPAGLAVSAVLMFRIFTFWLPTVPGWLAFHNLQRKDAL